MKPVPCIVCKRELEAIGDGNHADDANAFQAPGQYGSMVFDPMDGTFLEINVCDRCLIEASAAGRILRGDGQSLKPFSCEPGDSS